MKKWKYFNENLSLELKSQQEENKRLSAEIEFLNDKLKYCNFNSDVMMVNFEILSIEDIQKMKKVNEIGDGSQSKVFEVVKKNNFALKELKIDKKIFDENRQKVFTKFKRFVQENQKHIWHLNLIIILVILIVINYLLYY